MAHRDEKYDWNFKKIYITYRPIFPFYANLTVAKFHQTLDKSSIVLHMNFFPYYVKILLDVVKRDEKASILSEENFFKAHRNFSQSKNKYLFNIMTFNLRKSQLWAYSIRNGATIGLKPGAHCAGDLFENLRLTKNVQNIVKMSIKFQISKIPMDEDIFLLLLFNSTENWKWPPF